MKVGLVLGAGGVLGGAWLTGGLNALARETGWDPGSADFVVGTSAGSMVGALIARRRAAVVHGRPLARRDLHRRARRRRPSRRRGRPRGRGRVPRPPGPSRASGPGSLRMVATALSNPLRRPPLQLVAGWLPAGVISTDSLKDVVRRAVPGPLGRPPQLLGRHVRLRHRQARALRPRGRAGGGDRRRRGRLVRDPRLLPPGAHRRPPLRGRRHLLGVEPRPARRARARSRDLPEPALVERRSAFGQPARLAVAAQPRGQPQAARPRGAQGARVRHQGGAHRAHRGRPAMRWAATS